jgi:hypothetical protein
MRLYAIDRLILVLATVCAAVFGLHWLGGTDTTPLTARDAAAVKEIRVLHRGELQLDLLRDADGWTITHPEIARARSARVGQLLALLRTASLGSWPVSKDLLAQSGLNDPARTLQFDDLKIEFGGPSTPPGQRYVRVGDRIHLIDELWFYIGGLPASHYRKAD